MSILLNGDCLEEMKALDDNSIDLIFCDLPYGQTSLKWDTCIDLDLFWKEVMRIKKLNTAIFFTTTTKFGASLIQSAPKKCHFRYDIVWVKSAPAGFLLAKKMPLRKHEMIYVFYEKLPYYDLSSHKHKFLDKKEAVDVKDSTYGTLKIKQPKTSGARWDPALPVSVVKEANTLYGDMPIEDSKECGGHQARYDPPLPVSVVKEEEKQIIKGEYNTYNTEGRKKPLVREKAGKYDPPLPVSVVNETFFESDSLYGKEEKKIRYKNEEGKITDETNGKRYDPPLPVSVVKEETGGATGYEEGKTIECLYGGETAVPDYVGKRNKETGMSAYEPPLPNSMLEIRSTRGKHSTEKPVALMEWILKYYSKEGDVVLDPTMGSGSTGIACKNMNRNFIGIEKDLQIFEVAVERNND